MKYNGGKIKMIPYEEKDQENLVKFVTETPQGFLVSDVLVTALTKKLTKIDDFHRVWMVECECSAGTNIGTVILQKINYEQRMAQLVITFDEGEISNEGKLFKEVYNLVSDYVFNELNFFRLQVEVLENNLKLKKAYKDVGLIEEGLLRNKYEIKDKRYDAYVMSMLKIEWARGKK